jgi:hypothetical protein
MKIFNLEINGADIEWFFNLSKQGKFDWIKKETNQKNDVLINEFLDKPLNTTKNDYCVPCRENKQKVNIAEIGTKKAKNKK